jgi:hypothetical protein
MTNQRPAERNPEAAERRRLDVEFATVLGWHHIEEREGEWYGVPDHSDSAVPAYNSLIPMYNNLAAVWAALDTLMWHRPTEPWTWKLNLSYRAGAFVAAFTDAETEQDASYAIVRILLDITHRISLGG